MATPLQRQSELEAVNIMLSHIQERPVNTLEGTGVGEAASALDILRDVSRRIQSQGLHCNTEFDYTLPRNSEDEIPVPSNMLSVILDDPYKQVVIRENKLYDKTEHTYKFDDVVEARVVFLLSFEDLDEHVRDYVTAVAAREFQAMFVGSSELDQLTRTREEKARVNFMRNEVKQKKLNLFKNPVAGSIIGRAYNLRPGYYYGTYK